MPGRYTVSAKCILAERDQESRACGPGLQGGAQPSCRSLRKGRQALLWAVPWVTGPCTPLDLYIGQNLHLFLNYMLGIKKDNILLLGE